jgi:hypothetical protein
VIRNSRPGRERCCSTCCTRIRKPVSGLQRNRRLAIGASLTKDGLFAICESPRTCAQMETLPCSFFGTIALVYLFPELALSTLRAEKAYQFENGAPAMIMGGECAWSGGCELADPRIGYQVCLNPVFLSDNDRPLSDAAW